MKTKIMNILIMTAAFASAFMMSSCTEEQIDNPNSGKILNDAPQTIKVLLTQPDTKLGISYDESLMTAFFELGDSLSVVPWAADSENAGFYKATEVSDSPATFTLVSAPKVENKHYGIFHPASLLCDIDFIDFSYKGQVQKKSEPLAHLSKYFTIRKIVENYDVVDLTSDVWKSSCMVFNLSGMTFQKPSQISISVAGSNTSFYETNRNDGTYYIENSGEKANYVYNAELSLGLEGYDEENSLTGFMMMSNYDVNLTAGTKITVTVTCEDGKHASDITVPEDMVLEGGHCHQVTVDGGWYTPAIDYTQYDYDGEVVLLHKGHDNLNIVLMGDGYIAEDFEDGTYDQTMREAYDNLFYVEPYKYFKDNFSVYYVKVVSHERMLATTTGANGAKNGVSDTALGTTFVQGKTSVDGDKDAVLAYAEKALTQSQLNNATIVVIANQQCHSGTCHNYYYSGSEEDYAEGYSISYFGLGRTKEQGLRVMRHEVNGHGFGKLDDEYGISNTAISDPYSTWGKYKSIFHKIGMYRNVDIYTETSDVSTYGTKFFNEYGVNMVVTSEKTVLWKDLFGTDNNYESEYVESLGVFVGGNAYPNAFCRPTENGDNSIMNQDTGIFNAISRRQIIYRMRALMGINEGKFDSTAERDYFLKWDAENFLPNLANEKTKADDGIVGGKYVLDYDILQDDQVLIPCHYVDGRLVEL